MAREMITIVALARALERAEHVAALDRIFFASSNRQSFADEEERAVFHERWLGRYLGDDARHGLVVLARGLGDAGADAMTGRLIGYLVASLDNPAKNPRFADIAHFRAFAHLCDWYPAQLHINMDAAYRNFGIGERLIERFCRVAELQQVPGVHVVTGAGARNIRFYNRCGFDELGRDGTGAQEVVFLGRALRGVNQR